MEDAATNLPPDPLPREQPALYGAPVHEGAGESLLRERANSLADMAVKTAAGGRVLRVVVVEQAATGDYVPYLRCSWQPELGYRPLSMRRYEGARSWSDFRTLRRVVAGWGYTGPIVAYPEGHPRLACLGIGTPE